MSWGTEDHKHNAYDVYGVAEEHHRHYDLEDSAEGLRADLRRAEACIGDLEDALAEVTGRIAALETQTPQARQLQMEADLAAADLAESGCDRHGAGCECPDCPYVTPQCASGQHLCSGCDCGCHIEPEEPEPEEYDPGPEFDDEGGLSGYRHALPGGEPW